MTKLDEKMQNYLRSSAAFYITIGGAVITVVSSYFLTYTGLSNKIDLYAQKLDLHIQDNNRVQTQVDANTSAINEIQKVIYSLKRTAYQFIQKDS